MRARDSHTMFTHAYRPFDSVTHFSFWRKQPQLEILRRHRRRSIIRLQFRAPGARGARVQLSAACTPQPGAAVGGAHGGGGVILG